MLRRRRQKNDPAIAGEPIAGHPIEKIGGSAHRGAQL
jgi:hypothetical protein